MSLRKFRCQVTWALVAPRLSQISSTLLMKHGNANETVAYGSGLHGNELLSVGWTDETSCSLCRLLVENDRFMPFACVQCRPRLDFNSFTAYQWRDNLSSEKRPVKDVIHCSMKICSHGEVCMRRVNVSPTLHIFLLHDTDSDHAL